MRAIVRQSGQLADQRSGTVVAVRAPERFAPNSPTLKALALCIAWRCCWAGLALDLIIASLGLTRSCSSPRSPGAIWQTSRRWTLFGSSCSRWLTLLPRLRFLLGRLVACDAHGLDSVGALHVERP